MSSNQIAPPRLPEPRAEYDLTYMQDLIRALEIFIQQERNPGEMRGTKITLTALPTSSTGLETGALWNDSGTVKIVTQNNVSRASIKVETSSQVYDDCYDGYELACGRMVYDFARPNAKPSRFSFRCYWRHDGGVCHMDEQREQETLSLEERVASIKLRIAAMQKQIQESKNATSTNRSGNKSSR